MIDATEANRLREEALMNYYSAERRAGATPDLAHERLDFFAQRLDNLFEGRILMKVAALCVIIILGIQPVAHAQGMGTPQGRQPPDASTSRDRAILQCFRSVPFWSGRDHDAWLDRCLSGAPRLVIQKCEATGQPSDCGGRVFGTYGWVEPSGGKLP